jgi:hypothetical protein
VSRERRDCCTANASIEKGQRVSETATIDDIDVRAVAGVEVAEIDGLIDQLEEEYTALDVFIPTLDTTGSTSACTRYPTVCKTN